MLKIEEIKRYWEEQVKKFEGGSIATNPDEYGRELEIKTLVKHLKRYPNLKRVLDIGCGTGYTTIELTKRLPDILIDGADYSESMVKSAQENISRENKKIQARIDFFLLDILTNDREGLKNKYEIIITSRCLINLVDFVSQKKCITNICNYLKHQGIYLMMENTVQGMRKMNDLREAVGLHRIPMRWHNQYFDENTLLPFLEEHFELIEIDNFESTYVIGSRVFNAALTPEGQEPDYKAEINLIASKLPSIGDCGPTKLIVLKKRQ